MSPPADRSRGFRRAAPQMVSTCSFYLSLKIGTKVLLSGHWAPLFFTIPHDSRWAFSSPTCPPGDFSRLEGLTAAAGALLSPPSRFSLFLPECIVSSQTGDLSARQRRQKYKGLRCCAPSLLSVQCHLPRVVPPLPFLH